jgi:hypothetical protein
VEPKAQTDPVFDQQLVGNKLHVWVPGRLSPRLSEP